MNDKERDAMFNHACFSLLTAQSIFHSIGIKLSNATLELVGKGRVGIVRKLPENPIPRPDWNEAKDIIDDDEVRWK